MDADARADADLLAEAARQAGDIARSYFRKSPSTWMKDGRSPVSEADIAVDRYLSETLRAARPHYGWLSEETADNADRLAARRLFVVDPIDGTRAYLEGVETWAVSVAVVEDGRPVAGAIVAPMLGETIVAIAGGGARLNGESLRIAGTADFDAARVAGAKAPLPVTLPRFTHMVPRVPSLALRFARVATGTLDAAFASKNAHDWDIAAADLALNEAGGRLTDFAGRHLVYNRPQPTHPALVAAGVALHARILRATTTVAGTTS